jgi:predicted nucleic acid-binding protein
VVEPPVANASPLILLAKGGCFELLRVAGEKVVVPRAVASEVRQRGPNDPTVQAIGRSPWIEVVNDPMIPGSIQSWDLGSGESAVLALAFAKPEAAMVILDDRAARRCAAALGIPVLGTLGIVLLAKQAGMIPAARPVVERMRDAGMYLLDRTMNQALALIGE